MCIGDEALPRSHTDCSALTGGRGNRSPFLGSARSALWTYPGRACHRDDSEPLPGLGCVVTRPLGALRACFHAISVHRTATPSAVNSENVSCRWGESNPHAPICVVADQVVFGLVRACFRSFPSMPFKSPGSRRTASNACHHVKPVSSKRAWKVSDSYRCFRTCLRLAQGRCLVVFVAAPNRT